MKVLVIGGVAAGTKTAAKLKRMNRDTEITIVTKGRDISYAGCGLPYYVGNVIPDKEALIVNTPAKFSGLTGVQVMNEREVYRLDPGQKKAFARNLRTGAEEEYTYDSCIVASGASPVIPPVEGVTLPGVFPMRTPEDAIEARDYLEHTGAKRAVVVGAGFIGLEIAENLLEQGLAVTVIDMAPQIMPVFDPEIAEYARRHLVKQGIRIFTDTRLEAIEGTGKAEHVRTDKGSFAADVVVLSLGIRPNTAFLDETGIAMAGNRTILTDAKLRTNLPDVYAVGDCAMVSSRLTKEAAWSPMGSSANMEGRTLAQILGGEDKEYPGVLGTGVVKLPGLNGGRTGLSEAEAARRGYDVVTALTVTDDKAHYYPGAAWFAIKLMADRSSHKLLGVQVLGPGAVDKIVDVGVVALTMEATLEQLENMDMAYAPPFSTAIHPFVTAVNVLENKISGKMDSMTPAEYLAGAAKDYRLIDTALTPSLSGALYVDLTQVNGEVPGLAKDEKLLLVCSKGKRAYMLQNRLKHYGYTNTLVLEGATAFNDVKVPKGTGTVTVSPEDITRVKALGFLHNKGTDKFNARIITRNGKITAEESQCIAEAAKRFGSGEIAMTTRLTVEIQGVPYDRIEDLRAFVAEAGLETGGTGSKVRPVVACKGTTCQYGLLDTFGLSNKIHELFFHGYAGVKLPHKFKIAVGGCPNNCVKPDLNDFGIIGQRCPKLDPEICRGCKTCAVETACPVGAASLSSNGPGIDPQQCNNCGRCIGKCPFHALEDGAYGYKIYIGGRWGKRVAQGHALSHIFESEEEVLAVLEKAILLFREQGKTGERFADTIARLGFENVEAQLMDDAILKRKEEIVGARLHMVGGATC